MKMAKISELRPGMVLAQPLQDLAGRTLLKEGAELTESYIERISKWGFEAVAVEGGEDEPEELTPAVGYQVEGRSWDEVRAEVERRFSRSAGGPVIDGLRRAVLARVKELVGLHGGR